MRLSDLIDPPSASTRRAQTARVPEPCADTAGVTRDQRIPSRMTGKACQASGGTRVPEVVESPDGAQVADVEPYQGLFGGDGDTRMRKRRSRPPMTPVQRAIGLLSRREHSRKELARKLTAKGVEVEEVRAAVDRLTEAGWQDERRFAESLVRSRASSGYGPLHIRAELATHDLPAEVRQEALDGFDGDWLELARDQVTRRFGPIDDARLRARKAGDYLVRRGFPGDIVRAASRPDADD